MSTPSNVSSSVGRYVDARPGVPTASITASAATWRGNSMAPLRSFPILAHQSFVARGNGRFGLIDTRIGPRVGAARGTIDCWFKMGTGADSVVLLQSVYSSTASPLITLGVNGSGQATGSIQDGSGTAVAVWTATTMGTIGQNGLVHLQLAWDAPAGVVKVRTNGVAVPATAFSTAPPATWIPFQPLYLATGNVTETAFDGEMILTQASLRVVI